MSENRKVELNDAEKKEIEKSVAAIRKVFRSHGADIKSLIGTVTDQDIKDTEAAIEVRFSEEAVLNVQMNMVAFD